MDIRVNLYNKTILFSHPWTKRASFEGNLVDLLATAVDTYIVLLIYKVQCIVREDN